MQGGLETSQTGTRSPRSWERQVSITYWQISEGLVIRSFHFVTVQVRHPML